MAPFSFSLSHPAADRRYAGLQKRRLSSTSTISPLKKHKSLSIFERETDSCTHVDEQEQQPPRTYRVKKNPLTFSNLAAWDLQVIMSLATPNPKPKHTGISAWQSSALSAGATSDHVNPNKIVKPKSSCAVSPTSSKRSSRHSSISSRASISSRSTRARGTRTTDHFILFWGGPLSNWNLGPRFSGQRAMDLLLPMLDSVTPQGYPSAKRFSTHMLATHTFSCGEQWMMACKAWLFETSLYDLAKLSHLDLNFKEVRHRLMVPREPEDDDERAFHKSTLCRILRASHPRDHKELGRSTASFSDQIWDKVSIPIVVTGSVARAEADRALGDIYWENRTTATDTEVSQTRHFVEGSPYDRIWGVGLSWDDKRIENEMNWKGENRLGRCHDEACRIYCGQRMERERGEKLEGKQFVVRKKDADGDGHDERDGGLGKDESGWKADVAERSR